MRFLILFLSLLLSVSAFGQRRIAVMTDTNGIVINPTNFWTANSTNIGSGTNVWGGDTDALYPDPTGTVQIATNVSIVAGTNITVATNGFEFTISSTASGSGDMTVAIYDVDEDGVVDVAEAGTSSFYIGDNLITDGGSTTIFETAVGIGAGGLSIVDGGTLGVDGSVGLASGGGNTTVGGNLIVAGQIQQGSGTYYQTNTGTSTLMGEGGNWLLQLETNQLTVLRDATLSSNLTVSGSATVGTNVVSNAGSLINGVGVTNGNLTAGSSGQVASRSFLASTAYGYYWNGSGTKISGADSGGSSYMRFYVDNPLVMELLPDLSANFAGTLTATNGVNVPNGAVTATNFTISGPPKWIDALATGTSIGSNPTLNPPALVAVPGTALGYEYAYAHDDTAHFSIQCPHTLATTNASFPQFYYEPHIHVSPNDLSSGTNATFRMELTVARVYGNYTNTTPLLMTNSVSFTNLNDHLMISFGNITNNTLAGSSSTIFRGSIQRIDGGDGDIGDSTAVFVDSIDFHVPIRSFGSSGQFGE